MASTQDALYSEIDLELSWSERDLPERERTKHVHRLHPYLGKFIPQLVETLLERYVPRGGHVLDPFAGSGTTLVQALESGFDATGVDIAAFNCLLMRVKTQRYNLFVLERELRDVVSRLDDATTTGEAVRATCANGSRRRRRASCWRSASSPRSTSIDDVLRVVLARAARSARLTTHFDLDFPRAPQRRAVLVPQAQARVPSRREREAVPAPLHARHADAHQGVREGAREARARRTSSTATRARSISAARSTASSRHRRTRG